jgi:hypothetical protein
MPSQIFSFLFFRKTISIQGLFFLSLLMVLSACATPRTFDNGLFNLLAPDPFERRLILIFERENSFRPISGALVKINLMEENELLLPHNGQGTTDSSGQLEVLILPRAEYDQSALKNGDLLVEFPINISITLFDGEESWEWTIDDRQSLARYRDPLYQGLNRDPTSASYLTLTLP